MIRPYPAHAYSDAPRAGCYWPTTLSVPSWPALAGDLRVDVAIIGGGVTGVSAALHLAQAGASVALCDTRQVGWGASGRNGGFCCLGGAKATDAQITRALGADAAQDWRRTERAAVEHSAQVIETLGLEVDRHSKGETMLAHSSRAWDAMQAQAPALGAAYDVTPELIPRAELADHGMGNHGSNPFHGALTLPVGFGLNPLKYLIGLAQAATKEGAQIFDQTPVTGLTRVGTGWQLTTPTGRLTADQVILATNGYSSDDLPTWLKGRFLPAQSAVLVTDPIPDDVAQAQGWSTDQMAYTSREFLHYFRRVPCGRMLFGMRGSLLSSPRADARAVRRLHRAFAAMFPKFAEQAIPHVWSGLVSLSRDLMPFCGPVPRHPGLFAALNYHGNGVAMGGYCGALLADLVGQGVTDKPYPQVLHTPPQTFPLAPARRHLLWPAYGWRMLWDN